MRKKSAAKKKADKAGKKAPARDEEDFADATAGQVLVPHLLKHSAISCPLKSHHIKLCECLNQLDGNWET